MRRTCLLLVLLFPLLLTAQIKEDWITTVDQNQDPIPEFGQKITVDAAGNTYIAGATSSPNTYEDFTTIKYDPTGQILWQQSFNGSSDTTDFLTDIEIDAAGNVFVSGISFTSTLDSTEAVLVSYDPSGNQRWLHTFPKWFIDEADIGLDAAGNVYLSGGSIQPNAWGQDQQHVTLMKYSNTGVHQWTRIDTSGFANNIEVTPTGNVYISAVANPGADRIYLTLAFDAAGNLRWRQIEGSNNSQTDWIYTMALDQHENVYVSGYQSGNFSVLRTVKYDSAGTRIYTAENDTTAFLNWPKAMAVDPQGNCYITYWSFVYNQGRGDIYIIKLDSSGNKVWSQRYLGPYDYLAEPFDLALDDSSNIYIAGRTYGTYTGMSPALLKFDSNGNRLWEYIRENPYEFGRGQYQSLYIDSLQNVYATGAIDSGASDHQYHLLTQKLTPCITTPTFPIIGPDTVCANSIENLYVSGGTPGSSYEWEVGGGIVSGVGDQDSVRINWGDGSAWPVFNVVHEQQGLITVFETDTAGCLANSQHLWVYIDLCLGEEAVLSAGISGVKVVPNPFSDEGEVVFELSVPTEVRFELLNIMGAKLVEHQRSYPVGRAGIPLDSDLAVGIYFARLSSGDWVETVKVVKE